MAVPPNEKHPRLAERKIRDGSRMPPSGKAYPSSKTHDLETRAVATARPEISKSRVFTHEATASARQLASTNQPRDITFARPAGTGAGVSEDPASSDAGRWANGEAVRWDNEQGAEAQEEADTLVATGTVSAPSLPRFKARDVIASSSWTGNRTLRDQVLIVEAFAPTALTSVFQLIGAIEERRFNDPATQDSLRGLRELHQALGELIALADTNMPMTKVWRKLERAKEKVTNAVWDGAQVMLVAPALAVGSATILSLLSGFPVTDNMVTALCATSMGKDAILTLAKRR